MKTAFLPAFYFLLMQTSTILLGQVNNPPQNLYVDPLTLHATWESPDTIRTMSQSMELLDYYVFMDDSLVGVTVGTEYDYDTLCLVYGTDYTAGVTAHYTTGFSDTVSYEFTSDYLPPVTDLTVNCFTTPILSWTNPACFASFIIGFNIYRDGDFVIFMAVNPAPPFAQTFIDEGLPPGIYTYTVTTVYDLSPFGFPGEEGESMEVGPAIANCNYGFHLPFYEDWISGNFDEQYWSTDGANWAVNGGLGNPAPAAEFSWDPIISNYENGLESYPLRADTLDCGKIFLEFDIRLIDVNPTGNEKMDIQVWNWSNQEYTTVDTFSNVAGSFSWLHRKLDITPLAMQQIFKVRFLAQGENSLDILSWFVDNIHVYHDCYTPYDLDLEEKEPSVRDITINWRSEYLNQDNQWIHWDDGINYDGIGTSGAAENNFYFEIYRSVSGSPFGLLAVTTDTIYIDYDLQFFTRYCYKVRSVCEGIIDTCISAFPDSVCGKIIVNIIELNDTDVQVYPNPADKDVSIVTSDYLYKIQISSMLGEALLTEETKAKEYRLDVSGLPPGIYLLKITMNNTEFQRKVIVMH